MALAARSSHPQMPSTTIRVESVDGGAVVLGVAVVGGGRANAVA
jgi:hypothetical protein